MPEEIYIDIKEKQNIIDGNNVIEEIILQSKKDKILLQEILNKLIT